MKKIIKLITVLLFISTINVFAEDNQNNLLKYRSYVEGSGWQDYVTDGNTSGTSGKSKKLEGIEISIDSSIEGNIMYKTHIQDLGWENNWRYNGETSGNYNENKRIEAIRIKLEGTISNQYDIIYRVHVQDYGWLGWAKNGEASGTTGASKRIEAIEIKLVEKGTFTSESNCFISNNFGVTYSSHIEDIGWQSYVNNGIISGTTGKAKRVEAFKINLYNSPYSGTIKYQSYIEDIGWENTWKINNEQSGTTGEAKRIEAIRIKLEDEISEYYDIYYRVHVADYGWLNWAKNGEISGTLDKEKRIEAIEVKLIKKNTGQTTSNTYISSGVGVKYSSHVEDIGWQDYVKNGETSGTTGKSKRIESFKAKLVGLEYTGTIKYQSYIQGKGWETTWKENNEQSGTTGEAKRIEAIKIMLEGEVSNNYDVYYRVHLRDVGWLGWAKNGEIAGNVNFTFRIEAIEVKLVLKNTGEETGNSTLTKETSLYYKSHVQDIGDTNEVTEGIITGTTGKSKRLEAYSIRYDSTLTGNIQYKSYLEGTGWEDNWKNTNELSGTTGQSKGINLIQIKLDGELAERYNVYYRVHSEQYGWLGWAVNGEEAGATYYNIEAIEIRLYLKSDSEQNTLNRNNHYILTGFSTIDGNTYYKDKNGNYATDWINIMNTKYFFNSLGVMIGKNVKKVIDVSAYQGDIDWDTIKATKDVDGVILRIAAGAQYEDAKLARNISEVQRLGIPYGIYIYSYAENYSEGEYYANFTIDKIKKYNMNPTIGIFLDLESNGITSYMGVSQYEQVVRGYTDKMFSSGYGNLTKIYTYKNYADTALNSSYIRNQITWIAEYNHFCTYSGSFLAWQYSSHEKIAGINGDVDASVWFTNF